MPRSRFLRELIGSREERAQAKAERIAERARRNQEINSKAKERHAAPTQETGAGNERRRPARRSPTSVVRISFRDLTESPPRVHGRGYIYRWTLDDMPDVGQRILVPGMEGPAWAYVTGVNDATREELREFELKSVIRLATDDEIAQGKARYEADLNGWLDMMRSKSGLPTSGRLPGTEPTGYPDIPPTEGTASPQDAGKYGSAWWRAYKNARDDAEKKRFQSLARRWYAIRDRG